MVAKCKFSFFFFFLSYLVKQSLEAEVVLYMPVAYFSVVFNTDTVYYRRT